MERTAAIVEGAEVRLLAAAPDVRRAASSVAIADASGKRCEQLRTE